MISDYKFHFTLHLRNAIIWTHTGCLEETKQEEKSIEGQSENILRGPIAESIVSKKKNFKKHLHQNIEEKRLLNLASEKIIGFCIPNAFIISILGLKVTTFAPLYVSNP